MKKKKATLLFKASLCLLLGLMLITPVLVAHFFVPGEIKLMAGEEHLFNFELPLYARIEKNAQILIKDEKSEKVKNRFLNLNHPFYVTMQNIGETQVKLSLFGMIPLKTVSVEALPYQEVIPCGKVVGIRVNTEGVLVLGTGKFEVQGELVEPCKGILRAGDLIVSCNGKKLSSKEVFRTMVESAKGEVLELKVVHGQEERCVKIKPVYSYMDNEYKVGLWVRDSTQGIGTMTYINPNDGTFGALGHGIVDSDTKCMMPVKSGEIMCAEVTRIKKGLKGTPGEISGIIDDEEESQLGEVTANTAIGIYGKVKGDWVSTLKTVAMPIAFQDEVHEGKASVLVGIKGNEPKEYEVHIQKVSKYSSEPAKGMVIEIVDPELLAYTGGIIQGMSGSPIIQDGKLIGAVTHVFVHDPTSGYGIFIENMINNEKR